MSIKKEKKIHFADYANHFSTQVTNADNLREESLQRLHKIRISRKKSQQRQLNRLREKFGEKDISVIRQADRITHGQDVISYLEIMIDKTAVDTDYIKDSYILRGKLRGDTIKNIAGHTVQLVDARNNVIGKPVKTDTAGNYSIVIDVNEGEKPRKLNIAILDKKGIQIHVDKLQISLKADVVDIRDITIVKNVGEGRIRVDGPVIKDKVMTKKRVVLKTKTINKKTTAKKSKRKSTTRKKR